MPIFAGMKRLAFFFLFLIPAASTAPASAARCTSILTGAPADALTARDSLPPAGGAPDTVSSPRFEPTVSPRFLRELEGAFSFAPEAAPLPRPDELTPEQLHQWVGTPDGAPPAPELSLPDSVRVKPRSRFTREYFLYKCYLDELGTVADLPQEPFIPGLTGVVFPGYSDGGVVDVNHSLSMIFSRKYRERERMRRLAEEHQADMEEAYPLTGPEPYKVSEDNYRDWDRPGWLQRFLKK